MWNKQVDDFYRYLETLPRHLQQSTHEHLCMMLECHNLVSDDCPDGDLCFEHLQEHIRKLEQNLYEAAKELTRLREAQK